MNKIGMKTFTAACMAFQLSVPATAAQVIGIATARGSFLVNNLRVADNATLFDGSVLETNRAASEARLAAGTRLVLAPGSKATVHQQRITFEKGQGEIAAAPGFSAVVGGFRIEPRQKGKAAFALVASNRVRIAAVDGAFTVRNAGGVVLATLKPGTSLEMSAQGGSNETKIVGEVKKVDGKYVVTDEATNATFELKGENLEQFAGKRVEVSGSTAGNTVTVTTVSTAAGTGISTTAVIAGVLIVSGAGAGLTLGLTGEEPRQTTSR